MAYPFITFLNFDCLKIWSNFKNPRKIFSWLKLKLLLQVTNFWHLSWENNWHNMRLFSIQEYLQDRFFFTSTKINILKTRALNSENSILMSNLNWNMSIYVKLLFWTLCTGHKSFRLERIQVHAPVRKLTVYEARN